MKMKIFIVLMFVLGIGVFSYPAISNYLAEKNQAEVIESYSEEVKAMKAEEMEAELKRAEAYNENLEATIIIDPFTEEMSEDLNKEYLDILNVKGVMGRIRIPKIQADIPIYHGTSAEVLQKGVGHIENTSLPVGGVNTHAVLSGHRGLPSAKLFSDLDELEIGDRFYIEVLNRKLLYVVDQVKVVLPDETEDLRIIEGGDYVTLVTCTPYGVNTHRLLVRGVRTEMTEEELADNAQGNAAHRNVYILAGLACAGLVCLVLAVGYLRRRGRSSKKRRRKR